MIARLRRSDILLHGAVVFGGVLVSNVFSYLFYVLIGRRAGVVVYGEVTSLTSTLLVLGAPANVLQLIAARLSADFEAAGDLPGLSRLARTITRWTAFAGAAVVAIAWIFQAPIARFFNLSESLPIVLTGAGIALYWMAYGQRGVFQGAHKFADLSVSIASEAIVKVVVGVALVASFGSAGALSGFAIGLGVGATYNMIRFARLFPRRGMALPYDGSMLARIFWGIGVGQLTLTALTFYDVPLVKHAFDKRSAGLYAAAALVGRVVVAANAFIPTIVLPKAAARVAAGRSPLPLLVAAVALATACGATALVASVAAPQLVVTAVAGRAFGDAANIVPIYVFAFGALSLATVVAAYNFALHRYHFVIPMSVAAAAEMLTLAFWHPSLSAVVGVLAVGHVCVFAATLYGVAAAGPRPATTNEPDAAFAAVAPVEHVG